MKIDISTILEAKGRKVRLTPVDGSGSKADKAARTKEFRRAAKAAFQKATTINNKRKATKAARKAGTLPPKPAVTPKPQDGWSINHRNVGDVRQSMTRIKVHVKDPDLRQKAAEYLQKGGSIPDDVKDHGLHGWATKQFAAPKRSGISLAGRS